MNEINAKVPFASQLVLTTYFTSKNDPQRGITHPANDFELMRIWYESLHRVGLHAIIFHDCLSDAFIAKNRSELLDFEYYLPCTGRSVNDERFYLYLNFLESNQYVDSAFMVDLFDVEFFSNPFNLFDDEKYDLYCGGDLGELNNKYNRERMLAAYGEPFYENEIKLIAGTLGGRRRHLLNVLRAMCNEFDIFTQKGNLENFNMPVFNKVIYDLYKPDKIMFGNPLNSKFKHFEKIGDFAIRHK